MRIKGYTTCKMIAAVSWGLTRETMVQKMSRKIQEVDLNPQIRQHWIHIIKNGVMRLRLDFIV